MFILSEIEESFGLSPRLLDLPIKDAIRAELDSIFLDKVIENLGLCISIYDLRSIEGGFVVPGEGTFTYTVKFRTIMFKPVVGEVISARLKESTQNGLRLTLDFFEDIYVPLASLPTPNHYERDPNPKHKNAVLWRWDYEEDSSYPIDWSDEIRLKVQSVNFSPLPLHPQGNDSGNAHRQDNPPNSDNTKEDTMMPFALMVITVSLDLEGLGPKSWWV